MIYGLIPVGGKGKRLGLPFSKEMLPQKGFDFYNPILGHLVSKMLLAGADRIVFVHGQEYKEDVFEHYFPSSGRYLHILQSEPSFAGCLKDFHNQIKPQPDDDILFGLPDSIFEGNLFLDLLTKKGLTCGLFKTLDSTKVDRLSSRDSNGEAFFYVKSQRSKDATEWFWGVIKFIGADIERMKVDGMFERYTEVGHIINHYPKQFVQGGSYIDLGTWENLNEYWNQTNG